MFAGDVSICHYLIITNDVLQHYRRTLGPPKFRFFFEEELDAQYPAGVFGIGAGDVRPQDNILQTPSAKLPCHPQMKALACERSMESRIPARLLKHLIENGLFGESHRLEHQEA